MLTITYHQGICGAQTATLEQGRRGHHKAEMDPPKHPLNLQALVHLDKNIQLAKEKFRVDIRGGKGIFVLKTLQNLVNTGDSLH